MSKKILIIEDEGDFLMLIKRHLEERGFEVSCFLRGQEGLEEAKKIKPDLVLLDLTLPDIDGMEVYARLKLDKETERIPIIFVTARCLIGDIEKAFRMGVDDYVCKPVELDVLVKKIKKTLNVQ